MPSLWNAAPGSQLEIDRRIRLLTSQISIAKVAQPSPPDNFFKNFKGRYGGMRRQGMVEDSYSSMIRLLAVNLASNGIFDGLIREKVDSMREKDPDLVRKAIEGITMLKELKRV
jgi:hypothetical protein